MNRFSSCRVWAFMVCLLCSAQVQADFICFPKGGSRQIVLEGRVIPGRTMTYIHPSLGKLYFKIEMVDHIKAIPPSTLYGRMNAKAGEDPEEVFKSAIWALKKGLVREYFAGVEKTLKLNPKHAIARKVLDYKKTMDQVLPDNPAVEKELQAVRPNFRIVKGKHFLLLTDTPEKGEKGEKNRATKRLELLEEVYTRFILLFLSHDVELTIPTERMKVVLFNNYADFKEYSVSLSPSLASASGFWEHERNVSFFFDHSTTPLNKLLAGFSKDIDKAITDAQRARAGETVQFLQMIKLLIKIDSENGDITVVSHEATHQLAGNTGLFPRHVRVPKWVHEGLATYFEAPADAAWAGIGAVNEERLEWYREVEPIRELSNIDFIIGDEVFDYARSLGLILNAYAQAWALTHFMMENHPKEFIEYYRMVGELPPDVILSPELLTSLFNKVFGKDRKEMELEWRSYMRTLKTDKEKLLGE